MLLTFQQPYKSLTSLPQIELPNFSVVTGFNGAGKSHLLQAIEAGNVRVDDVVPNQHTQPIRMFNWTTLFPSDTGAFAPSQITQERDQLWQNLAQIIQQHLPDLRNSLLGLPITDLWKKNAFELSNLTREVLISDGVRPEIADTVVHSVKVALQDVSTTVASQLVQIIIMNGGAMNNPAKQDYIKQVVDQTQSSAGIPFIAFNSDIFYDFFPSNWQSTDLFQQAFSRLFADYQRSWRDNRLRQTAPPDEVEVRSLSDEEFVAKYGEPPWVIVNTVLETASLDFRINQPHKYDDRPYEPILTDRVRRSEVRFNDLSSGEKILMSFALCLYYAGNSRQVVAYPKILLFDEIDAPLHPSMTQSLLRTIEQVLVKQRGIKVIMTTHSPSTVALCPEESLYVMHKDESKRLQKSTKDRALDILTTGVPTLSIDYQNRRQVFVESYHDAGFYEKIYDKLKGHLTTGISINFITSGSGGKGNCDDVKKVVNELSSKGNRTVYGIIDWDLKNGGNERVKVLGHGKRYSIENYILDPVLVAALLLREKVIGQNEVGLTYADCVRMDNTQLQTLANYIVGKVESHIPNISSNDKLQCLYTNGEVVELPEWFVQIQGHLLEETLKHIIPHLRRYQREDALKSEILDKVVDDMPSLIPLEFLDLFKKIQNME